MKIAPQKSIIRNLDFVPVMALAYTPSSGEEDNFAHLLLGKDLRKLKGADKAVQAVHDQASFDALFKLLFHHERPLVMRAADAVEKISVSHSHYLEPHKKQLLGLLKSADHKELKWHIAQMVARIALTDAEKDDVWHMLTYWVRSPTESKIVRVNALQACLTSHESIPP
ncbi:MAG TPA: hypothetical protein VIU12_27460 [Chryseolinea sp.]